MKYINKQIANLIFVGLLGVVGVNITLFTYPQTHLPTNDNIKVDNINVCFTPPSWCGRVIAEEIRTANSSIYLEAYGFTSRIIIDQLIDASKRRVKVRAILDRSNFSEKKKPLLDELTNANIEIVRDTVTGIAHNKIMIIDNETVITGSFNFTESADKRNAENVIIIIKDSYLAKKYMHNWFKRYEESIASNRQINN